MTIELFRHWQFLDFSGERPPIGQQTPKVTVPPGIHAVEIKDNPWHKDVKIIVLKDTMTGMAEGAMRDWSEEDWNDFRIIVKDDD